MKVVRTNLVIFLCLFGILILVIVKGLINQNFTGICTKIIDGDTVIISGKRIRLAYIDAPESDQLSFDKRPIGEMGTKFLKKLILGKKVKVRSIGVGKYDRIIGIIYLKKSVNLKMVKRGLALSSGKNSPLEYRDAQYRAQLIGLGIFATSGFLNPSFYRKKFKN